MWSPRPADPEVEAIMLQRLMVRLGADEKTAKAQVATAGCGAPKRSIMRPSISASRFGFGGSTAHANAAGV